MYVGPATLGATDFAFMVNTTSGTGVPTNADATPTYRIYAQGGTSALLTGTMTAGVVDSQTGLYKVTSLSITAGNGFAAGNTYCIRIAYAISATNRVDIYFFTVT